MFEGFAGAMYRNIIELEVMIFTQYKINPFEFLEKMTVLDLQSYMSSISNETKKENERKYGSQQKSSFAKLIITVRDIFNYMTGNY